jgi:hypothetical protein
VRFVKKLMEIVIITSYQIQYTIPMMSSMSSMHSMSTTSSMPSLTQLAYKASLAAGIANPLMVEISRQMDLVAMTQAVKDFTIMLGDMTVSSTVSTFYFLVEGLLIHADKNGNTTLYWKENMSAFIAGIMRVFAIANVLEDFQCAYESKITRESGTIGCRDLMFSQVRLFLEKIEKIERERTYNDLRAFFPPFTPE